MSWDEHEHPRNPHTGEFTDKSSWAARAVSRMFPESIPRHRQGRHSATSEQIDEYRRLLQEDFVHAEIIPKDRTPEQEEAGWRRTMRLMELREELHDAGLSDTDRGRIESEERIEYYFEQFRRREAPQMTPDELRTELANRARASFQGKQVAVRVQPSALARILQEGRFKTIYESRSRGFNDPETRAKHEAMLFGLEPDSDPAARPVYGYLVDPQDIPHADKDTLTDALSQYGRVQLILRPEVRARTTAMFGDSLDLRHVGMPSPVDDPEWYSFTPANPGGLLTHRLSKLEREMDPDHRAIFYLEAQVHGGVRVDDIEQVVFPSTPSADLKRALEQAGIPWRVVKS